VPGITAQGLAGLVPCPLEQVERLEELGILSPGEDGAFAPSDAHLVRLMEAFEGAGISVEDVARGVTSGQISFPLGLFMPEPVEMRETYAGLAERVGRSPELLRRLSGELGFPAPDDDRMRDEDAKMLELLVTTLDLATDDELSRFARLYGGSMQRLVTSGLQYFDAAVQQRIAAYDIPDEERDALIYQRAAGYTELVRSIVPWLQGRHREHSVLSYLVNVTEGYMEERGISPRPDRQPPAIAFLDLTGYSRVAEERGDEAAAKVASRLASVVQEIAEPYGGRPVKWLGDGVMFHFDDPEHAIQSGLDLVEQTERTIDMPARIGINAGNVIVQEGDYFGRTVNVAARIADYAGPHQVLVSDDAKQSCGVDGVEFELVGDVELRGVPSPVRLHRAMRAAA
jgi:class 3 adenylate cyclase